MLNARAVYKFTDSDGRHVRFAFYFGTDLEDRGLVNRNSGIINYSEKQTFLDDNVRPLVPPESTAGNQKPVTVKGFCVQQSGQEKHFLYITPPELVIDAKLLDAKLLGGLLDLGETNKEGAIVSIIERQQRPQLPPQEETPIKAEGESSQPRCPSPKPSAQSVHSEKNDAKNSEESQNGWSGSQTKRWSWGQAPDQSPGQSPGQSEDQSPDQSEESTAESAEVALTGDEANTGCTPKDDSGVTSQTQPAQNIRPTLVAPGKQMPTGSAKQISSLGSDEGWSDDGNELKPGWQPKAAIKPKEQAPQEQEEKEEQPEQHEKKLEVEHDAGPMSNVAAGEDNGPPSSREESSSWNQKFSGFTNADPKQADPVRRHSVSDMRQIFSGGGVPMPHATSGGEPPHANKPENSWRSSSVSSRGSAIFGQNKQQQDGRVRGVDKHFPGAPGSAYGGQSSKGGIPAALVKAAGAQQNFSSQQDIHSKEVDPSTVAGPDVMTRKFTRDEEKYLVHLLNNAQQRIEKEGSVNPIIEQILKKLSAAGEEGKQTNNPSNEEQVSKKLTPAAGQEGKQTKLCVLPVSSSVFSSAKVQQNETDSAGNSKASSGLVATDPAHKSAQDSSSSIPPSAPWGGSTQQGWSMGGTQDASGKSSAWGGFSSQ